MGKLTTKPCPGECGDVRARRADELCWKCREAIRKWKQHEEREKKEAKGIFEIDGEKTYAIWDMRARWLEDRTDDYEPAESQLKDAPEGRMWNSTCHNEMFKEEKTRGQVITSAYEWARKMLLGEKFTKVHASDAIVCIRFVRREVWCLTWFSHYTFDVGQSDQDTLASFQRYVDRTERINAREGKNVNGYWREPHCLMGAEERWRWRGSGDDGDRDNRTDPPCRCKHCKEQGLIRIGH